MSKFNFGGLADDLGKDFRKEVFGKEPLPVCPVHHKKPELVVVGKDTLSPKYCCDELKRLVEINRAK